MSWNDEDDDTTVYKVVVNHEEQYSLWPEYRENPMGWNDTGKIGSKQECLAYVNEVWTDMRPLSLRKKMQELECANANQGCCHIGNDNAPMDELVGAANSCAD